MDVGINIEPCNPYAIMYTIRHEHVKKTKPRTARSIAMNLADVETILTHSVQGLWLLSETTSMRVLR